MSKKIIPKWRGIVRKGILEIFKRDAFVEYVKTFENKNVELIVKKESRIRSLEQNAYYWGCVIKLLCESTGDISDDMNNHLAQKFLKKVTPSGILTFRNPENLEPMEFEEYLAEIRPWASAPTEQGGMSVFIPLPNEVDYSEYL